MGALKRVLAVLALVGFGLVGSIEAQEKPRYQLPTLTHWCVGLDAAGKLLPPGQIQLKVRPESDPRWTVHRYPDGNGGFSQRGTAGLHTPDYRVAMVDLELAFDEVDVRDSYCVRDVELLERAQAVRISGDTSTPFQPGIWSWGRRSWDVVAWQTFVQYNRSALIRNMGAIDAGAYIEVIEMQLALAVEACRTGSGPAADPAAGGWQLNKAGACRPMSWTRAGALSPDWARPVRIELSSSEAPGQ